MSDLSVRCLCNNINADKQTHPSGNLTKPSQSDSAPQLHKGLFWTNVRRRFACIGQMFESLRSLSQTEGDCCSGWHRWPLLYLSWRTRSVGVVRRIRCMLCLFPQPKERHSSQRPPLCCCLKITSSHTCFPSAWLLLSLFSVSLAPPPPHIFSLPSPYPPIHAFIIARTRFEDCMLFLSIKTQYGFFSGASSRRNIWRLMCTLLIVDSDVLSEVTFISSAQQPQLKRTRIKQRCTCEAIAHDLFQYQESHWYSDKFLL